MKIEQYVKLQVNPSLQKKSFKDSKEGEQDIDQSKSLGKILEKLLGINANVSK